MFGSHQELRPLVMIPDTFACFAYACLLDHFVGQRDVIKSNLQHLNSKEWLCRRRF